VILPDGTNSVKLQLCPCSLLLVIAPWIFLSKGNAADFTGPIVSALDGDTIEVLHNQHPERIRLNGIDCPEKGKAFGTPAKQAASA
jgi:micrococcal nuclease